MSSKSGKTPTKKSSKSTVASPQGQAEVSKTPKTSGKSNSSKASVSTASVELGEHNMVNLQQVFRASRALKTHVSNLSAKNNGKTQLLASESPVTVEILLHKVPITANMKRHVITLSKPIRDKTSTDICVFVRDSKTAKEKLSLASAPNIKKVIALSKLRTHYNQYEARRLLAQSYDLFLVEDTILPDVCRQLGSSFLRIRKAPVPIRITSRAAETIAKIRDATLFDLSGGVTQSYKIGDTGFTEEELVKNFAVSIDQVVKRLPLGWSNVKQIALIAAHCAPLPVYNNLVSPSSKASAESSNDNTVVKDASAETTKTSKSKRPAPSVEETDAIAPSSKKTKVAESGKSSKANGKTSNTPSKDVATPSKKSSVTPTKVKSEAPKAKSETPKAKSDTPKTPKSTKSEETTPKSATKASTKSSAPSTPATPKTTASTSSSSKAKKTEEKSPKTSKQTATPKASTPSIKKPSTPSSSKKK